MRRFLGGGGADRTTNHQQRRQNRFARYSHNRERNPKRRGTHRRAAIRSAEILQSGWELYGSGGGHEAVAVFVFDPDVQFSDVLSMVHLGHEAV